MELDYRIEVEISPKTKLMGRMKLGEFFSLPEDEFSDYMEEIEEDKSFQDLLHKYRIVKYRKFPAVKQDTSSPEFKEGLVSGGDFDLEDFVEKDPKSWRIVRKVAFQMGEEQFSRFLQGNEDISIAQISEICELTPEETEKFRDFINNFQLQQDFFGSDEPGSSLPSVRFFRVARIENQEGTLFIVPVGESTYLLRGRYAIDYERWGRLIEDRQVSPETIKRISAFFRKLDIINQRTATLYQILLRIKETQHSFLLSGNIRDLVPSTQRQFAAALEVHPSTISRLISGKSIVTPQGQERALKDFFVGEKERIKTLISDILKEERKELLQESHISPLSDDGIRKKLQAEFGIHVARRTVTKYRRELNIPPSHDRKSPQKAAHL